MDKSPFDYHIEMWKHYDSLRQEKNSGFLTANSILVAISGFLFQAKALLLMLGIAGVGVAVCVSWFLLLKRNAAYVEYHREQAGGKDFWKPKKTGTPPSTYLERTPSVVFFVFWLGIAIFLAPYLIKIFT